MIHTALAFVVGLSGGLLPALMKLPTFPLYRWIATGWIDIAEQGAPVFRAVFGQPLRGPV